MAKIPSGILGAFLGKAGPVSGHIRNGQAIMRTSTRRKDNKVTPDRQAQQQKIKVCNAFTKAFTGTGFFNKSFPAYGNTGTGYNRATAALMNLAIMGNYPGTAIFYPKVLISRGPYPKLKNATASLNTPGDILFCWTDNTGTGTARENDKAIFVAYFPDIQQAVFSTGNALRGDGQGVLAAAVMQGYSCETWMGFLSNDEMDAANSVYAGRVDL
jgi:hypothetical protein